MTREVAVRAPEIAVSVVDASSLIKTDGSTHWRRTLADSALGNLFEKLAPTHVYLGSEFCEHLIPASRSLLNALGVATELNCRLSLLTPISAPADLRTLGKLLPHLPDESEVIVSDWGTAYFIREHFPNLTLVAGRILCRMGKDPRIPAAYSALSAPFDARPMKAMLARLGFVRMEVDVPIFDSRRALSSLPLPGSVHVPFACVAKGRMCRIGSTAMRGVERFAVGRRCRKECLRVSARLARPHADDQRQVFQLGNSIVSRVTDEMLTAVLDAVNSGSVSRLVVPGDPI
ncbi:Uncharacterized protein ToN1_01820 [Aromatoleum petrolei]|nr:Uncharacterized protein ToN1_01820 [Aromatoleum petrolei]